MSKKTTYQNITPKKESVFLDFPQASIHIAVRYGHIALTVYGNIEKLPITLKNFLGEASDSQITNIKVV